MLTEVGSAVVVRGVLPEVLSVKGIGSPSARAGPGWGAGPDDEEEGGRAPSLGHWTVP